MRKLMLVLALSAGALACGGSSGYSTYATVGASSSTYYGQPRVYTTDAYPGYLWVDGHYEWVDGRRVWMEGYYIEDRPGYVYYPGYTNPRTHIFVSGTWRVGGQRHYYRMPREHRMYRVPPHRARARDPWRRY